jgi:hypothetical protein
MSGLSTNDEPGAAGSRQWQTLVGQKKVLAIAPTVAYAKRLTDVLALLEDDFRIQAAFTFPPHALGDGVPGYLSGLGSTVLPWNEAVRTRFDLALAAGPRGVAEIRGPLVMLPHGAGFLKRMVGAADPHDSVCGLRREDLVPDGRTLPAAVVLPHRNERSLLAQSCPEALTVAHVVGDPAHDRIRASLIRRAEYRRALGLSDGQKLVVVASTWGPRSAFPSFQWLLPRLLSELPGDVYRTAVLVHPNVWAGHGPYQLRSWLAHCEQRGIRIVPPEADWRSVLIAADRIIGDHGSVTTYGTLTGAPILLACSPEQEINPASPAAVLARTAPALSPAYPLLDQLEYAAAEYRRRDAAAIASAITSQPLKFNRNMRRLMYRVLGLGQPAHAPVTRQLPLPPRLDPWARTGTGPGAPA